jgi:hypothetical protein
MLINIFLDKPIQHKQIEKTQYVIFFIISLYATYNCYYVTDLTNMYYVMLVFLCSDFFYIPFNKIDSFIHHTICLPFILYPTIYSIPMDDIYEYNITFLKVEISSIFLSTSYFIREFKKISNNKYITYSLHINNVLFLTTFLKYRCYDFVYYIGFNPEFYQVMIIPNSISSQIYVYLTIYPFMALNIYWLYKIVNVIYKFNK